MKYIDITARSIAMEKRRIERVAERGPVWDSSLDKYFERKYQIKTHKQPPENNTDGNADEYTQ